MEPFVTIGIAIIGGMLASAFFSYVQSQRRGVPASEHGLREYVKQLEKENHNLKDNIVESKAVIQALEADIKVREKEREALRDERVQLYIKIGRLESRIDNLEDDLRERPERSGGISASGNSSLNIGRDATGNDSVRS